MRWLWITLETMMIVGLGVQGYGLFYEFGLGTSAIVVGSELFGVALVGAILAIR